VIGKFVGVCKKGSEIGSVEGGVKDPATLRAPSRGISSEPVSGVSREISGWGTGFPPVWESEI